MTQALGTLTPESGNLDLLQSLFLFCVFLKLCTFSCHCIMAKTLQVWPISHGTFSSVIGRGKDPIPLAFISEGIFWNSAKTIPKNFIINLNNTILTLYSSCPTL